MDSQLESLDPWVARAGVESWVALRGTRAEEAMRVESLEREWARLASWPRRGDVLHAEARRIGHQQAPRAIHRHAKWTIGLRLPRRAVPAHPPRPGGCRGHSRASRGRGSYTRGLTLTVALNSAVILLLRLLVLKTPQLAIHSQAFHAQHFLAAQTAVAPAARYPAGAVGVLDSEVAAGAGERRERSAFGWAGGNIGRARP